AGGGASGGERVRQGRVGEPAGLRDPGPRMARARRGLGTTRMTISSRRYADEDLPRLQEALAAWRREVGLCGYCHVGDLANRIYEGLHGLRPVGELVRVWEEDSGIAGVAICLRFG